MEEIIAESREVGIVYLMTHYPRVALTFISSEIDAIERGGLSVFPISINLPSPQDLPNDEACRRSERTLYLKAVLGQVIFSVAAVFITRPWRSIKLLNLAMGSSGLDLKIMMTRLIHLAYASHVFRICNQRRIHHIHAHFGLTPASIAWFASELSDAGSKRPITWSFTIHGFQDFIEEKLARLDLKARSASFVVCISDFTRSQLCRITDSAYWPRFHVVRCGIDLTKFSFRGAQRADQALNIITVGRLSPEKGHIILLHAVRVALDRGIVISLRIVGSGPFEAVIRAETKNLNLEQQVKFLGEKHPDDVVELLKKSDVFCLPSFSEGLPVSIMEAMAIGVPVVTTGISGIPELARNGTTAWTVPPANVVELAEALVRVASDRASWPNITQRARAAVERDHDIEKNTLQLRNLFGTLTALERG